MIADHKTRLKCTVYPDCPWGEEMERRAKPKMWWYLITPLAIAVIGFFTWQVNGANSREARIKALETAQSNTQDALREIREDVKYLVRLRQVEMIERGISVPDRNNKK